MLLKKELWQREGICQWDIQGVKSKQLYIFSLINLMHY